MLPPPMMRRLFAKPMPAGFWGITDGSVVVTPVLVGPTPGAAKPDACATSIATGAMSAANARAALMLLSRSGRGHPRAEFGRKRTTLQRTRVMVRFRRLG